MNYTLFYSLSFGLFCSNLSAEALVDKGFVPEKGEIKIHPSDRHIVQWGEDVAAHTYGQWQLYKPNDRTIREKKRRSFWVDVLYHGGWYHAAGFQPKKGHFRLTNGYGVWEHNPVKKRLNFRFVWPGASRSSGSYDRLHDCYWEHYGNANNGMLIQFEQERADPIKNMRVMKSALGAYKFTDEEGRIHFDKGTWALMKDGKLTFYDQRKVKGLAPVSKETTYAPSWRFGSLDNGGGFGKQFPEYGVNFKLMRGKVEWFNVDKDGRAWIYSKGLYCLDLADDQPLKYERFLKLLPVVFGNDGVKATKAMHSLLQAKQYKAWVLEVINSEDPQVKAAARKLQATMNGGGVLVFSGYLEQWQKLKAGKGKTAEILPTPEVNRPQPFIETDPLILNVDNAGKLKNYSLNDAPVFEPPEFNFGNTGAFLHSANGIQDSYLKVEDDEKLRLTAVKCEGDIYNLRKGAVEGEALAQVELQDEHHIGIVDIQSGKFKPLMKVKEGNFYNTHMATDAQGRVVIMSSEGRRIAYQSEFGGKLIELKLKEPKQTTWGGGILWSKNAIYLYRGLFQRQWDGEHSDIKAFRDGKLVSINGNIPGHIYHLSEVNKDTLLVATRNPSNMFFVNASSGKVCEDLFKLARAKESYTFLPDALTDKEGNFWFYTNWVSGEENHGRLQMWDGKNLKTVLNWQFHAEKQSLLNPYMGNMTMSEDGKIWLGIENRMLVFDTTSSTYRFFRVPDRNSIPKLYAFKNRVMAHYEYGAPAVFSLVKDR